MNIVSLIISLLSGAAGGNIVGALAKKISLGVLGNSLSGILGGGLGSLILQQLGLGGATGAAASGGGLDLGAILGSVASGGVGGGVVMAIIAYIKQMMGKK